MEQAGIASKHGHEIDLPWCPKLLPFSLHVPSGKRRVDLLQAASPAVLRNTDKQHKFRDFSGLAPQAAAASLNASDPPLKALQPLEQGRNVISSFLLDMQTDISGLKQRHPSLAEEFESLRDQMDTTPGDSTTFNTNGDNVNHRYWKRKTV